MQRLLDLPDPGERGAPRYAQRPLPSYRYVPGLQPHPTRDPRGHSYQPQPTLNRHAPWDPAAWRTLDTWRYGVDLFNRFYFWEAHEAWEGLWAAVERETAPSLLLQGLIQIAAALLKAHMQVPLGVHTLSAQGLEKLQRARATAPRLMGLDLTVVIDDFTAYFAPTGRGELSPIDAGVPMLMFAER